MSEQMKLFIWHDVQSDWTQGIVAILAHNHKEAIEVALRKSNDRSHDDDYETEEKSSGWWEGVYNDIKNREPDHVFSEPDGCGVSGGG